MKSALVFFQGLPRFAAVLLSLAIFSANAWAEKREASQFFDTKIDDFKAELKNAKQAGKKGVLLMFTQEDCPWCRRMEETVLNQSEVQDYFHKQFAIYHVDIKGDVGLVDFKGKQTTEKQFSAENRVRATPVFAFYDLDGNYLTRFTGAAKDSKEFLQLGKYVEEGAYKRMPFNKYRSQMSDSR